MIGTAISLPRSKLKRRCVRSTSNTITFAGKTYEISKLGKHLPLHKSYKLLSRKLFRDYSPFSAKRFQSCLSSRNNPFLFFEKRFARSNLQFENTFDRTQLESIIYGIDRYIIFLKKRNCRSW